MTSRLAGIGPFSDRLDERGERAVCWDGLPALRCEFPSVRLCFRIQSLVGDLEPDGAMFGLWDRYRPRHAEHAAWFKDRAVAFYRGTTFPSARGRQEFPADLPDAEVIRQVEGVEVAVVRQEDPEFGVQRFLAAYFEVPWDREHLSWLLYDPERDAFGDWM